MSRTFAKVLGSAIDVATLPLGRRQREKTIGRLAEDIGQRSIRSINTSRGELKFYALRGAHTASAVSRFGQDEPETVEWLETYVKPGEILWDIGANIGLYSLYASLGDAKVFAFEPSALNYAILNEHIYLNKQDKNIHALCVALGSKTQISQLHIGEFTVGHASNALEKAVTQFKDFNPVFSQGIPAFSMDDFCATFHVPAPDHIKLDVDGIEDQIIVGGVKTLASVKSVIIEVEGRNAQEAEANIIRPLLAAGLKEREEFRAKGSKRNRLYVR
jgi:FkbM family methyltransferase